MSAILLILGIFFIIFIFGALLSPPKKHKDFGYKDQQRAMRAFDRSDLTDAGVPPGGGKEKKRKGKRL